MNIQRVHQFHIAWILFEINEHKEARKTTQIIGRVTGLISYADTIRVDFGINNVDRSNCSKTYKSNRKGSKS